MGTVLPMGMSLPRAHIVSSAAPSNLIAEFDAATVTGLVNNDYLDTWEDSSGGMNDISNTGGSRPRWVSVGGPASNPAISFNVGGIPSWLTRASWATPPGSDEVTVILVIKWTASYGSATQTLVAMDSAVAETRISATLNYFTVMSNGSDTESYTPTPLVVNTWYIVAAVVKANSLPASALRVNGSAFSGGRALNATMTFGDLSVGAREGGTNPLAGLIPHIKIFNKTLSEAELANEFTSLNSRYSIY